MGRLWGKISPVSSRTSCKSGIKSAMRLKVLFITRNYPPKIGGLEAYSYNLIKEFEAHNITHKIVLTRSNVHLVWFLPYCLLRALCIVRIHPIQLIHLCDGLLAPIGILLKVLTRAKISISIAGLDITYRNFFYQLVIPWCVARLDKVICLSHSTRDECVLRGIPHDKCVVIPVGVRPNEVYLPHSRADLRQRLEKLVSVTLRDKIVLVSVGRLVRRKGVSWFVRKVMPRLQPSYCYLIVGDGPEYGHVQEVLKQHNLHKRVLLLGKVSDEERNLILNASDIFIMPNIEVPGDVEGFGIVAIEAGSCGLPVIASNIQGIRDAVLDGKTGVLVEERDAEGYLREIENMRLNRDHIRSIVNSTFDWSHIHRQYRDALASLITWKKQHC